MEMKIDRTRRQKRVLQFSGMHRNSQSPTHENQYPGVLTTQGMRESEVTGLLQAVERLFLMDPRSKTNWLPTIPHIFQCKMNYNSGKKQAT